MISILGDYNYSFPKPIKLEKKLKDMLEDNVDEKYYLSDKMLEYCLGVNQKESDFPRGERFLQSLNQTNDKNLATTITTNAGNRPTDNFILKKDTPNYIEWEDGKNIQMNCRAWKDKVDTLNTGGETKVLIKNATKKGYLEATDGDGVDISSRMEHHRETVQKGKTQTLTTMGGETKILKNDLRIRKLTPKECGRLMNVKDEDIDKLNLSDSAMYHIFGDSICSNILMALFGEMLDIDWEKKVKEMLDMLGDDINE